MPSAPLSTFGPQTEKQFLSSVEKGDLNYDALQQSSTNFQWTPQDSQYYQPKASPPSVSAPPPLPVRKQITTPSSAYATARTGMGVTMVDHPVQLKEAVKHLVAVPSDGAQFVDALSGDARREYTRRVEAFASRPFPIQAGQEVGEMAKDAFVSPVSEIAGGLSGAHEKKAKEDNVTLQFIDSLMRQGKYELARNTYENWSTRKITEMSDMELMQMKAEHPVIANLAHSAGVMTMQFPLLRNAPFLKTLGDTLEAKTAVQVGTAVERAKTATAALDVIGDGTTFGTRVLSKTSAGMVKLASQLAGDIPANFVQPALNFDYEHRPISELPQEVLTNVALLLPSALLLHVASTPMEQAAIKATSKIAGMLKAMRVYLGKDASKAFERGIMGEEDNVFSRIFPSLSQEDQMALRSSVQMQRRNAEAEGRLIEMKGGKKGVPGMDFPAEPPKPAQDVSAAAKKTGGKIMDVAATRRSRGEVIRTESALEKQSVGLGAKSEFDSMVSDIRQFREGIHQGTMASKDMIRNTQKQLEDFIKEKIPPKYRSRALGLFKGTQSKESLIAAVEKLDAIAHNISIQEMNLGAERGAIKRSTKAGIKDILTNPPPDIELLQPYERTLWLRDVANTLLGEKNTEATEKGLTAISTKLYSSLTPVKDMPETWAAVKQYFKQVSSEASRMKGELDDILIRNTTDNPKEAQEQLSAIFRYRTLKHFLDRAEEGISNGSSERFMIPSNPDSLWLQTEIAAMESADPHLPRINGEITDWTNKAMLDQYKGRVPQPVLDEWKAKYQNYFPAFYDKYRLLDEGSPQGKTYNFTARDYLQKLRGGEGLEISDNPYNSLVRGMMRATSDKYTDAIATTIRKELNVKPLKIFETDTGKRKFQALIDGIAYTFDNQDLESGVIPKLRDQRIMYSQHDNNAYLVPKPIADLIDNRSQKSSAALQAFSALSHKWQDMTTTYNPSFALVANPLKDMQYALINTQYKALDFLASSFSFGRDMLAESLSRDSSLAMRRLKDGSFAMDDRLMARVGAQLRAGANWLADNIGTKDWAKTMEEFHASGADQGGYITKRTTMDANEQGFWQSVGQITHLTDRDPQFSVGSVDPKFIKNSGLRGVVRLKNGTMALTFDTVADGGSFYEKLWRGGQFKLARAEGKSLQQAGAEASDITLDFTEQGSAKGTIKFFRAMFPYKMAALRGDVKMLKAATGQGKGPQVAAVVATRLLTTAIAPATLGWLALKKLGIWDRMDPKIRNNYWVLPTGTTYKDEFGATLPVVITARMGEMQQVMLPAYYDMLDALYERDPTAFKSYMDPRAVEGAISNNLLSSVTPLLRVPFEVKANYDSYFAHQIDSDTLQKLPVPLRSVAGTTGAGTAVGDMLGISPNQGDYVLRTLFPAPFKLGKAVTKQDQGKPQWLQAGETLGMLNTPSTYFMDFNVNQRENELRNQQRALGRDGKHSPEQIADESRKIQEELNAIEQQKISTEKRRKAHPLKENDIGESGIDVPRLKSLTSGWETKTKEERLQIWNSLSAPEQEYLTTRRKK